MSERSENRTYKRKNLIFKPLYNCRIPYKKQGLIYFTCQNFTSLSPEQQQHIRDMCYTVGGVAYQTVLLEALTKEQTVRYTASRYYMSERNLYRLRRRFFELWVREEGKL